MSCACACVCPCLIFIRHSYRGAPPDPPKRGKSQTPRKINSSAGTLFKQDGTFYTHTYPPSPSLFSALSQDLTLFLGLVFQGLNLLYTLDNPLFFILGVCFSSYNSPVLLVLISYLIAYHPDKEAY